MSNRQFFRLSLVAATLCFLSSSAELRADVVRWRNNVDAAKIEAAQSNKLVLLHFWSTTCGPCKRLDSDVFSQPQIGQQLEQNFVPVKVNADISPALASAFNIDRVPTDVVLTSQGNVVAKLPCPPTPAGYGTQLANLTQHYRQQVAANNTPALAPVQSAYAGLKVGQYNNPSAATAPVSSQRNFSMPPAQTAQASGNFGNANGNFGSASKGRSQTSYNEYASATANPQVPRQVASATPGRYGNPPGAVAAYQPAQPQAYQPAQPQAYQPAQTQPAVVQMNSSPAAFSPQQQIAARPSTAGIAAAGTGASMASNAVGLVRLPAGSPPLAFEGYCPTTLKHVRKWVLGNPKFGAIHRGRTYLFTGDAQRQQFLANPDAYSPVFSGVDPVKLLDENKTVEGSRKFGYEYRGAFYLFASQESMARFASQPDQYAAGVRQAMLQMDGAGAGTIRR